MKPKKLRTTQRVAPTFIKRLLSNNNTAGDKYPLFEDRTERTVKN